MRLRIACHRLFKNIGYMIQMVFAEIRHVCPERRQPSTILELSHITIYTIISLSESLNPAQFFVFNVNSLTQCCPHIETSQLICTEIWLTYDLNPDKLFRIC